ncbi:unnamed protein product [Cochlearia groenlandica]
MSLTTLHGGSSYTSTTSSSTSSPACAACKHQRKKCRGDCFLGLFFPQNRHKEFLNVHKLFGLSKITNLLKSLDAYQREAAVYNAIFHANARALDPVGGAYKIIRDIEQKIQFCQSELCLLHQQIAMYRSFAQQQLQRQRQDFSFGYGSNYGDLLGEEYDYGASVVDDYDYNNYNYNHNFQQQNQDTMIQQQNLCNKDMVWDDMLEQIK